VIFIGLLIPCIIFFPLFIIYFSSIHFTKIYIYTLATGLLHAIYFFTLGKAYEHEDISKVYPIARGFGVAGTALVAYLLLQETLSLFGIVGILAVSFGTILVGMKYEKKTPIQEGTLCFICWPYYCWILCC